MAFAIAYSQQPLSFQKKSSLIATPLVNRLLCDASQTCFQEKCSCHQAKVSPRFLSQLSKVWRQIFRLAGTLMNLEAKPHLTKLKSSTC